MAYLIGLDPGKNTGIAVWNTDTQSFETVDTVLIHEALFGRTTMTTSGSTSRTHANVSTSRANAIPASTAGN